MNNIRSFVVTLLLAVGSGAMIGLLAFSMTGKGTRPNSASVTNAAVPQSSAPSPSPSPGGDEPMTPVQYDSPEDNSGSSPPDPGASSPPNRPVLM